MTHYVPLSKTSHGESGVLRSGYAHALNQAVVPLVAEELPQAVPTMPVAFVKSANQQGYELVALQSLEPGVNLYVHTNGRWIGGYKPAWYREHPFRLMSDASGKQRVLCVDEESPDFEVPASEKATRLLDESGEPTPHTKDAMAFLQKLDKARAVTRALVSELANANLIVPWQIKTRSGEAGEEQTVKGLFHIDEKALKSLDADTVLRLVRSGALSLAYTQLLSEHRLQAFRRLSNLRGLADGQHKDGEAREDVDLDELFGDDDDDLSFGF